MEEWLQEIYPHDWRSENLRGFKNTLKCLETQAWCLQSFIDSIGSFKAMGGFKGFFLGGGGGGQKEVNLSDISCLHTP